MDACLIQKELDERPIEVATEELQAGVDAFRRRRRLHSARATEAWLSERGMDLSRLESRVADDIRVRKLMERVAAERADGELDAARVVQLFEEWLRERRRAASIQWNWGDSRRTDALTRELQDL